MAFARIMGHYHMRYREILELPIRTFWFLNECVNRLEAESNLRRLEVFASAQSAEGYESLRQSLVNQMGTLMVKAPTLDRQGLEMLRSM